MTLWLLFCILQRKIQPKTLKNIITDPMFYLRNLLLVVLIKLLSPNIVFAQDKSLINGTLIITLTSSDTIWIGADSRTSALTDKGYTINKEGMCKIHSTNDVVYAMAGHVRYVDNSFNFLEIMRTC